MSMRTKVQIVAALSAISLAPVAQADAGFAVYGIVASWLAAGAAGSIYGNGLTNVATSGVGAQQISLAAGVDQDDHMNTARLAYRLDAKQALWKTDYMVLTAGLELSLGQWEADKRYANRHVTDFGITPMFKVKASENSPWYAEVGVGAHYLSDVKIKDYSKSTQFQFGDQFGLGWENEHFRLGYQYIHISNAEIETPNPSTDFHLIELGYRF